MFGFLDFFFSYADYFSLLKSQVAVCLLFRPRLFPISNTVCTFQSVRLVADNAGSLAPSDNNREASDGTSPDHSDNRKLEK